MRDAVLRVLHDPEQHANVAGVDIRQVALLPRNVTETVCCLDNNSI